MSKFKKAVPVLAELTGLVIFEKMRAENQALPMRLGIGEAAKHAAYIRQGMSPGGNQLLEYKVARALRVLSQSKRYNLALIQEGAMRHDERGNPVEPVHELHKAHALAELTRRKLLPAAE